jgi:molecular chaperone DnaJ
MTHADGYRRDYYEIGIAKNAAGDEIKSAYRKMAIKYPIKPTTPRPRVRLEAAEA